MFFAYHSNNKDYKAGGQKMSEKIKTKLMCAGATFSNMCDRFVAEGYKNDMKIPEFEEMLEMFAKMGGMRAIGYG